MTSGRVLFSLVCLSAVVSGQTRPNVDWPTYGADLNSNTARWM
jgi:hypothetical protein